MNPQVTRVQQISTNDATGRLVRSFLVGFTVGDHGPFSIQVPESQFTADNVRKLLAEFAMTLTAVTAPA